MQVDLLKGPNGFKLPAGLDSVARDQLEVVLKKSSTEHSNLLRIRELLRGGKKAVSEKYHQSPLGESDTGWKDNKKLLTHVNLVKPVVRCWTAAIYAGDVVRKIKSNPWPEIIDRWVRSLHFTKNRPKIWGNAVTYGFQVAGPVYRSETDSITDWLPDSVYTWILHDPMDINRLLMVAEVKPKQVRFRALWGDGILTQEGVAFVPRNYQWLPVSVAYGIDLRDEGEIYGMPLAEAACDWSVNVTGVAYNIRLMQKQQSRSLLKRIGPLEELDAERDDGINVGVSDGSTLDLPEGFSADYITPSPALDGSTQVVKTFMGLLACGESIPQDVLDATLTQSVSSAEAARIRAIPLLQAARLMTPDVISYEQEHILAGTAEVEYHNSFGAGPISREELEARCDTEIAISHRILPMSPNEETQDLIAQMGAGIKTPEDVIRQKNPGKTEAEVLAMADAIRAKADALGGMDKLAQQALQTVAKVKDPNTANVVAEQPAEA